MRYAKIDAAAHQLVLFSADTFEAAQAHCELPHAQTDYGVLAKLLDGTGLGYVVHEFSLFRAPINQHYSAVGDRLIAGNALIYAFNELGHTISLTDAHFDMLQNGALLWFENAHDVEQAILAGRVTRPRIAINGVVEWQWPERPPHRFAGAVH